MRFDYGYDEEQRLGKPYDLRLLRRILPYVRPHRLRLVLSALMEVDRGGNVVRCRFARGGGPGPPRDARRRWRP